MKKTFLLVLAVVFLLPAMAFGSGDLNGMKHYASGENDDQLRAGMAEKGFSLTKGSWEGGGRICLPKQPVKQSDGTFTITYDVKAEGKTCASRKPIYGHKNSYQDASGKIAGMIFAVQYAKNGGEWFDFYVRKNKGYQNLPAEEPEGGDGNGEANLLTDLLKKGDTRTNSAYKFVREIGAKKVLAAMKAHGSALHIFIDGNGNQYPAVLIEGNLIDTFDYPRPNAKLDSLYKFNAGEIEAIQRKIAFRQLVDDVSKIRSVHIEFNDTQRSSSTLNPEGASRVEKVGAEMEGFEIDKSGKKATMVVRLKGGKDTHTLDFCILDRAISNKNPTDAGKVNELKSLICVN